MHNMIFSPKGDQIIEVNAIGDEPQFFRVDSVEIGQGEPMCDVECVAYLRPVDVVPEIQPKIDSTPTPEEIQRVKDWTCSNFGHNFDQIMTEGNDIPTMLVCSECGKKARVVPETSKTDISKPSHTDDEFSKLREIAKTWRSWEFRDELVELLKGYDSYRLQAQIDGSDAFDPDLDVDSEIKRLWDNG